MTDLSVMAFEEDSTLANPDRLVEDTKMNQLIGKVAVYQKIQRLRLWSQLSITVIK